MRNKIAMTNSPKIGTEITEDEKRLRCRKASKMLFLCAFFPIALSLIFSNGLFVFLAPVVLWMSWICFILSASVPSSGEKIIVVDVERSTLSSDNLFGENKFPSFYGSSYLNALHPSHDDD